MVKNVGLSASLLGGLLLSSSCSTDEDDPVVDAGNPNNLVSAAAGGTVTGAGGVELVFPPGALSEDTEISITSATGLPSDVLAIPGTAVELGPDGLTFSKPVTLTLPYSSASIPSEVSTADLRLHKLVSGAWQPVAVSAVDTIANLVTGELSGFSTYGVRATMGVSPDGGMAADTGPNAAADAGPAGDASVITPDAGVGADADPADAAEDAGDDAGDADPADAAEDAGDADDDAGDADPADAAEDAGDADDDAGDADPADAAEDAGDAGEDAGDADTDAGDDAGPAADAGAGVCNSVVNDAPIHREQAIDMMPPTLNGGTIVPGRYHRTATIFWGTFGGSEIPDWIQETSVVTEVSPGVFTSEGVTTIGETNPPTMESRSNGTATVMSATNTVVSSVTCGGNFTFNLPYESDGTTLTYLVGPFHFVYTRQ